MTKAPRAKKCRSCKEPFTPLRTTQVVCSLECAVLVNVARHQKAKRDEIKNTRKRLKTRSMWLAEAQAAINKYCRLRDLSAGHGCISCGTHNGKMNGGHYKSVGASPETRFFPENISAQCERCNSHLSGNIINYRLGLIARYGVAFVESLEGFHAPQHYTIEEIEGIKRKYSKMARDLEKQQ